MSVTEMEGKAGEGKMEQKQRELQELRTENYRLRADNEILMRAVKQLKITLDRMVRRYVVGERKG